MPVNAQPVAHAMGQLVSHLTPSSAAELGKLASQLDAGQAVRLIDTLHLPARPAPGSLKTPAAVEAHVSRLLEHGKGWVGVRNQTSEIVSQMRVKLDAARGIIREQTGMRPLQEEVARLARERHAAVAEAKEELALALRRAENTRNPGAKLSAHYMEMAKQLREEAASDSNNAAFFGTLTVDSNGNLQQMNPSLAAYYTSSALSNGARAGEIQTRAATHARRAWPVAEAAAIVGRREAAVTAAKENLAAVKTRYADAISEPASELQPKLAAMRSELAPYQKPFLQGQGLVEEAKTSLQKGLEAFGEVRQGVPRGRGLLWALDPRRPFDLGDHIADARKQAEAVIGQ